MTDSQVTEKVDRGTVHRKSRGWWRTLLIFGAAPLAVAMLAIIGYSKLARSQDPKRIAAPQNIFPSSDAAYSNSWYAPPNVGVRSRLANTAPTTATLSQHPNVSPQSNVTQQLRSPTDAGYQAPATVEYIPYTDPNTGQLGYKPTVSTTYVRSSQVNWPGTNGNSSPQVQTGHDPRVYQLISELRSKQGESSDQSQIVADLQSLLNEEFTAIHKRHADELEAATKRLEHLKKVHEERGENRGQIIQRRIDQLTGKSNTLDWDMNPSIPTATSGVITTRVPLMGQANQATLTPVINPPLPTSSGTLPSSESSLDPPIAVTLNNRTKKQGSSFEEPRYTDLGSPSRSTFTPSEPITGSFLALQQAVSPSPLNSERNSRSENSLRRLNDVFAVITSLGEARLTEQTKAQMLDTYSKLHNEGRKSESDIQVVHAEFESASQRRKLMEAQLKAIRRTLTNEVEDLQTRLEDAEDALKATISEAEKRVARAEVTKSKESLKDAQELRIQFEEAMELINEENSSEPTPSTATDDVPNSALSQPPRPEPRMDAAKTIEQ